MSSLPLKEYQYQLSSSNSINIDLFLCTNYSVGPEDEGISQIGLISLQENHINAKRLGSLDNTTARATLSNSLVENKGMDRIQLQMFQETSTLTLTDLDERFPKKLERFTSMGGRQWDTYKNKEKIGPKLDKFDSLVANKLIKPIQLYQEDFDQCEEKDLYSQLKMGENGLPQRDHLRKRTQFLSMASNQMTTHDKRKAFAKRFCRSRSNVEKVMLSSKKVIHQRKCSVIRYKSILKKRGSSRIRMGSGKGSQKKVQFKSKKSVICFKTTSSVLRFKDDFVKQSKLKKSTQRKKTKNLSSRDRVFRTKFLTNI